LVGGKERKSYASRLFREIKKGTLKARGAFQVQDYGSYLSCLKQGYSLA